MRKQKIKNPGIICFMIMLVCFSVDLKAQQGTNTAGGEGKGVGGTVSVSIGQIDYIYFEGPGGNVSQGIQQTYSIETLSGNEISNINLSVSVYPNPSADFINLTIDKAVPENWSYAIYDMTGKLIEVQKLSDPNTKINLSSFNNGNYLIKILEKDKEVKTFKIIKTK